MMRLLLMGSIVVGSLAVAFGAQAVPTAVPYFGCLEYEAGGAVNSSVNVTLEVYKADVGGAILWGPHTFEDVPVHQGTLCLLLGGGSSPDLAPALDSGQPLWLAFSIDGVSLEPRQQVGSVPFARRAETAVHASMLGGLPATSYARVAELPHAALSGSFADLVDIPEHLATASGAAGSLAMFTDGSSLGSSVVTQSGGNLGVGVALPQATLHVGGGLALGMDERACTEAIAGTLRWTGSNLELCDGAAWAGLAGSAGGGGPTEEPLYSFSTATFSPGGQSGPTGPSLAQARNGLTGPGVADWKGETAFFDVQAGIQIWTVPATGSYRIEAYGARGGHWTPSNRVGGAGASVSATFELSKGAKLKILVGQIGVDVSSGSGGGAGGGGGTFVTLLDNTPLIVAGGGGGASWWSGGDGQPGSATTDPTGSLGGANGSGGSRPSGDWHGAGGGGLLTNGTGWVWTSNSTYYATAGAPFVGGGVGGDGRSGYGGTQVTAAGYGGGGGPSDGGGGGGGYNGGGAGTSSGSTGRAGGGGSYNAGTAPTSASGGNAGHGLVNITKF